MLYLDTTCVTKKVYNFIFNNFWRLRNIGTSEAEMELTSHQQKFIDTWGTLVTNWGINKTMAQIHALLMISEKPLTTEGMMGVLLISRGNTNMNLRALVEWGLASKEMISGDRKDFYSAKKDI